MADAMEIATEQSILSDRAVEKTYVSAEQEYMLQGLDTAK